MSALDFFDESDIGLSTEFFTATPVTPLANVMIDIETLSTRTNAAILSIGAVTFDMRKMTLGERFYATISATSCEAVGLHVDAATVEWWQKQSETARQQAFKGEHALPGALRMLTEFIEGSMVAQKSRCIWGNGANFDPVIVESAYRACKMATPWDFWGVRCFRTFKNIWFNVEAPERQGTHHNALDDAIHQAEWMFKIRNTLKARS